MSGSIQERKRLMLRIARNILIADGVLLLLLCTLAFSEAMKEPMSDPDPDLKRHDPARKLVRSVIQNELKEQDKDKSHFMYVDRLKQPGGEKVSEVVESNVLDLKLLIARDGQPLSPEEREKQILRLQKLISDPAEQEKERRNQDEDAAKAKRMLKTIPEAFLFKFERVNGDLTTLSALPDPGYIPSTREETVFHAIGGTITLNTREKRLVELRGELLQDVKFGFGILADLQRGGRILVQQVEVAPRIWRLSELDVEITGRALFFKSIGTQQDEHMSDFRRLPKSVPLPVAFDLLRAVNKE
jgi:hypothetical protein